MATASSLLNCAVVRVSSPCGLQQQPSRFTRLDRTGIRIRLSPRPGVEPSASALLSMTTQSAACAKMWTTNCFYSGAGRTAPARARITLGIRTFCISDLIVDGESQEQGVDGEEESGRTEPSRQALCVSGATQAASRGFVGSANATRAAFERNTSSSSWNSKEIAPPVQLNRLKDELLGAVRKRRNLPSLSASPGAG